MKWQDILKRTYTPEEQKKIDEAKRTRGKVQPRFEEPAKVNPLANWKPGDPIPDLHSAETHYEKILRETKEQNPQEDGESDSKYEDRIKNLVNETTPSTVTPTGEQQRVKTADEKLREMATAGASQEQLPAYLRQLAVEPSEEVAPPSEENVEIAQQFNESQNRLVEAQQRLAEIQQSENPNPQELTQAIQELGEAANELSRNTNQMVNIGEEATVVSSEQTGETSETIAGRQQPVDMSLVEEDNARRSNQTLSLNY